MPFNREYELKNKYIIYTLENYIFKHKKLIRNIFMRNEVYTQRNT